MSSPLFSLGALHVLLQQYFSSAESFMDEETVHPKWATRGNDSNATLHSFYMKLFLFKSDSEGKVTGAEHCLLDSRKFKIITILNLGLCNFIREYSVPFDISYFCLRTVLSFAFCSVRRNFFSHNLALRQKKLQLN
jgi:hypothetical protein